MKLDQLVTVKLGKNQSRGNEETHTTLYTYEDLVIDSSFEDTYATSEVVPCNEEPYITCVGDVVFSFVSSLAGIVSPATQGKLLNQNFAHIIIHAKELDKRYLCYSLNESPLMKKQMTISMQGSTIPKLTPAIFRELEIHLPSIEKQEKIGFLYATLKKSQSLTRKQMTLEEQALLELLKKYDQ